MLACLSIDYHTAQRVSGNIGWSTQLASVNVGMFEYRLSYSSTCEWEHGWSRQLASVNVGMFEYRLSYSSTCEWEHWMVQTASQC